MGKNPDTLPESWLSFWVKKAYFREKYNIWSKRDRAITWHWSIFGPFVFWTNFGQFVSHLKQIQNINCQHLHQSMASVKWVFQLPELLVIYFNMVHFLYVCTQEGILKHCIPNDLGVGLKTYLEALSKSKHWKSCATARGKWRMY